MTRRSEIPRASSLSTLSRRQVLQSIAVALTAVRGNRLSAEAAQHVHQQAKEERKKTGTFTPRTFTPHEFTTLRRLAELIIPADEISGSAAEAGAPEFIDLLCSQNRDLASVFTGGILWLDAEMRGNHSKVFVEASPEQQVAMLDRLVEADTAEKPRSFADSLGENPAMYQEFELYTSRPAPGLRSGRVFFEWLRNLTVDAFYTSEMGITDLGYRGNSVLEKYEVPPSIIEYALAHSPFKSSR
jgi:gluconate 2-dehydrogenase gamma chain